MCLLIELNKTTRFSDEFLIGVYTRNSDGIGVMWAEDGSLHFRKHLPKNAKDAVAFFRDVAEGKDCAVHFRMKTHGDIDFLNCHPYPVFGFDEEHEHPMLLMHNGVLSTGNASDLTKSDTWHFIKDFLRPMLSLDPNIIYDEAFNAKLGKLIGSNRFAVMDYTGRIAIVNRNQGVMYEGSWLSNTYAWAYHQLHPDMKRTTPTWTPQSSFYSKPIPWGNEDKQHSGGQRSLPLGKTSKRGKKATSAVQSFMDRLDVIAPDVSESIMFVDMNTAIRVAGEQDVDELIELLEYGLISETDFVKHIYEPDLIEGFLNTAHEEEMAFDNDMNSLFGEDGTYKVSNGGA